MQIEVGRFQDSLCLLRDYYTAMCKTTFPESTRGFTCVPLIDITADDHVELEEPKMYEGTLHTLLCFIIMPQTLQAYRSFAELLSVS